MSDGTNETRLESPHVSCERWRRGKDNLDSLRAMCAVATPGRAYSLREIGEFCGVSHEAVRRWEHKALMRARKLLATHLHKGVGSDLRAHLGG